MATIPVARQREAPIGQSHRASWLARRPLAAYFALAYAVSWALWLPYYLSNAGLGLLPVALPNLLVLFGQYGPTIAAFALGPVW